MEHLRRCENEAKSQIVNSVLSSELKATNHECLVGANVKLLQLKKVCKGEPNALSHSKMMAMKSNLAKKSAEDLFLHAGQLKEQIVTPDSDANEEDRNATIDAIVKLERLKSLYATKVALNYDDDHFIIKENLMGKSLQDLFASHDSCQASHQTSSRARILQTNEGGRFGAVYF